MSKRSRRLVEADFEPAFVSDHDESWSGREKTIATLSLLWENRRALFRRTAIGLVASAIIALLIPTRYSSTTRLMPPDQSGQGMASMLAALGKVAGDVGGASGASGQLLGLKTTGDIFVGVLRSRTVADDLINKFDLRKSYHDKRYADARKDLDSRTDVSSDRKSGIITLTVSDRNPDRAAAMAREYVEALNGIVITLNTTSAHKERVFLESRLGQVEVDLEAAEKDFSQFASKNTALDVKEQGRAMIGAAAQLEGELIAAQTELEGLRQIYTDNNVRVRSVQARIDEYQRQLQKMDGPKSDSAAQPPDNQSGDGQSLYPSIRQLPVLGVPWADLYRRTRVEEAIFETLTKQYELAKVEEARETPSVKVLDAADVPERKSFPPRLILILIGTFLVFVFSSLWILASLRWAQLDPQDPGKILGQDVLRSIRGKLKWVHHSPVDKNDKTSGPRLSHDA